MSYYAKTRIDAGKDKDGKSRVFEVGQPVTGLSDDEIKQLEQTGSLSDRAPREGEPGYQASSDSDQERVQREREQAQRDAAASGVGGPSSQRSTQSQPADSTAQQQPQNRDAARDSREPPGPDTTTKRR